MKINILRKFEDFSSSYLLLSSFLYLLFPCAIYRFFYDYSDISAKGPGIVAFLDKVFRAFSFTLLDTGMASLPIFLISHLLYTFLRKQSVVKSNWPIFYKFILAFLPAYFVMAIAFYSISIAFSSWLHVEGFLFLIVYCAYLAIYFALLSEVSKFKFIWHCLFVMPLINLLMAVTVILVGADISLV